MTKSKIIGRFDPEQTDITDLMNQSIQKAKHEPWYIPGTEFVTLYNVQDPDYPGIPFVTERGRPPALPGRQ